MVSDSSTLDFIFTKQWKMPKLGKCKHRMNSMYNLQMCKGFGGYFCVCVNLSPIYSVNWVLFSGIMSLNFTIPNRPVIESPCSYYQYMWSTCRYVELPCQCTPADTLCENLSHGASYEVSFPSENNSTYHVGCLEHTQPILRHIVTWSNVTDVIVFQDTSM